MPDPNESTYHSLQPQFPDLRIVPLTSLLPHEEHDAQRSEPLLERIREAGIFMNPPVVAPMDDDRFVILDGANRHYALTALGYKYILVQVVDYESDAVQLETWHHVISGLPSSDFLAELREVNGLTLEGMDLLSARAALARRDALAYTVLSDFEVFTLQTDDGSIAARTTTLRQIVDTYKKRGTLNRISTDSIDEARSMYPRAASIVVFPHYDPVEIIIAARDRTFLPPGITRHIIRGRAMRLNYPLEAFLEDGKSSAQKNQELQAWIQTRLAARRVRYYAEASWLFDE